MFKSGFVALMGSPNVGKSTLLNVLVGQKIAIVTKKPQTTRNRITGIFTGEGYQLVFIDTPGIHKPQNKLGEFMVKTATTAAKDVDVVLFLVDVKTGARERDMEILQSLPKDVPMIIAINKIDAVDEARIAEVRESLVQFDRPIMEISAKNALGIEEVLERLKEHLQEGPMFYPKDAVTDQSYRMIAAEIIREKALKSIGKEIPHGMGVGIEKFQKTEGKELYEIDAIVYCEKSSHKGIIIGAGGKMLKKIGSLARVDMETMLDCKVFLQVWVKVTEDWRNKMSVLKTLGYHGDL